MHIRKLLMPMALAFSIPLAGCAGNYAVEGAGLGAAAGAAVAAVTGEDIVTYAAAGAAVGGIAGYFKDKDDDCDGFVNDNDRYLDDDCRDDPRFANYF
ncbi:MAG: glycine zipper domain-containing protein [Pontixanthobacter sp.]